MHIRKWRYLRLMMQSLLCLALTPPERHRFLMHCAAHAEATMLQYLRELLLLLRPLALCAPPMLRCHSAQSAQNTILELACSTYCSALDSIQHPFVWVAQEPTAAGNAGRARMPRNSVGVMRATRWTNSKDSSEMRTRPTVRIDWPCHKQIS